MLRSLAIGCILTAGLFPQVPIDAADASARVGVFAVDASPPLGSPMAYDPANEILIPLSCRGIVLLGAGKPIVICAVDWIGIGNAGHRAFREILAKAAGTSVDHVAVHAVHQHDAPWCDFSVDALLQSEGIEYRPFDSHFAKEMFARTATAAAQAVQTAQPITHLGLSTAIVEKVASNRRILGPDGKVLHVRWSAAKDAAVREFPEGLIDPQLRMISLWNDDQPLVVLTYYATHPQSYYRTGKANPDFPGMARNLRQEKTGVPHIHWNGAGGNITAGKYNDGAVANRQVLADRMAAAMEKAWKETKKSPLSADQVSWKSLPVQIPAARHLDEESLLRTLRDESLPVMQRFVAANKLVWLRRSKEGDTIDIGCLTLDRARVLHMPGELFVEYQLGAQRLRPDLFVAMAAYGDYAPAYIGTAISYSQGGYETGPDASFVGPEVEPILSGALVGLLDADPPRIRVGIIGLDTSHALAFTEALNDPDAAEDLANCRVVAAYPQGSPDIKSSVERVPEYTKNMRERGVEIVDSLNTLLTKVDVVLLETNDGRPHLEQALPVFRANKPCFIDKPLAGTLTDAIAIVAAADKSGTPIFTSSSLRYTAGAQAIRRGEFGEVFGCDAFSPCALEPTHPDLFWYGIHGVESLYTVMGPGCETVCRSSTADSDFVVGTWRDGRIGTFRGTRKGAYEFGGMAFTAKGTKSLGEYSGYRPLVVEIVKFFRTGVSPVNTTESLEILAFMEAADESKRQGGKPVRLADVLEKAKTQAETKLKSLERP